jgi:ubiquinone/menaquinone biosynthesis C-methylase UbiE
MAFTREDQHRIWDEEHAKPQVLLQMDSDKPSSGVVKFYTFLQQIPGEKIGIEMGCGKGRNVIWLSQQQNIRRMYGLDFSHNAITEAQSRAAHVSAGSAEFQVCDIAERWPFADSSTDFVLDCFAITDIETAEARQRAIDEAYRVLKSGGYLLTYVLSTDDEFHKEMIRSNAATERNSFHHPTGKFEKTFDEDELSSLHRAFQRVAAERIEKTAVFNGKEYYCKHFWNVYRK